MFLKGKKDQTQESQVENIHVNDDILPEERAQQAVKSSNNGDLTPKAASKKIGAGDYKRQIEVDDEKIQASIREADKEFMERQRKEREKEDAVRAIFETTFLREVVGDFDTTTITDIKFNGTQLRVQCNQRGRYVPTYQPTQGEVRSVLVRIANIQGYGFTDSEPILDTEIGGVRISANHRILSPSGDTFAMRISRPRLALTNIEEIAPRDVGQLLYLLVQAGVNIIIAGVTGSGKTEVQKYLVGAVPDILNITLMEDTMDSHLKALYPNKDINSWRTQTQENRQNKIGYNELIRASLRNNPEWSIISETRGNDAASVLETALTGHSIMTTIHAKNAISIPRRIMDMIVGKTGGNVDIVGNNIVEYLPIGIHMKSEISPNGVRRYMSELMEYTGYENGVVKGNHLYKVVKSYDPKTGKYALTYRIGRLSENLIDALTDAELIHLVPKHFLPIVKEQ